MQYLSFPAQKAYEKAFGREALEENAREHYRDNPWSSPFSFMNSVSLCFDTYRIANIMASSTLKNRTKAVHSQPSVCGTGQYSFLKEQKHFAIPKSDLGGSVYIRHNYAHSIGAPNGKFIKSLSIRFGNVLHLILLSAHAIPFWNGPSFIDFLSFQHALHVNDDKKALELLKTTPCLWESYQGTPRHFEDYLSLVYYSSVTYDYVNEKKKHFLIRFRVVPKPLRDGVIQPAPLPSQEDIDTLWKGEQWSSDEEQVSKEKQHQIVLEKYWEHVKKKQAHYIVQYQIVEKPRDTEKERVLRIASIPWHDTFYTLGEFEINEMVEDKEETFDINQMLAGMFFDTPSHSAHPSSLNYFRGSIYPLVQKMRKMCFPSSNQ